MTAVLAVAATLAVLLTAMPSAAAAGDPSYSFDDYTSTLPLPNGPTTNGTTMLFLPARLIWVRAVPVTAPPNLGFGTSLVPIPGLHYLGLLRPGVAVHGAAGSCSAAGEGGEGSQGSGPYAPVPGVPRLAGMPAALCISHLQPICPPLVLP